MKKTQGTETDAIVSMKEKLRKVADNRPPPQVVKKKKTNK